VTQPAPAPDPARQPTAQEVFDKLDDRGKRDFVEKELGDVVTGLDKLIKKLSNVKVGAQDPDGVVEVTLGYNGRLRRLWMDPGATTRFNNLELEEKLNRTMRDALAGIDDAWAEETKDAISYLPPD
jgi:DNA-binding protein YbaB